MKSTTTDNSSRVGFESSQRKTLMIRLIASTGIPAVVYLAIRHFVHSDTEGLAIAGALPLLYSAIEVLRVRKMDWIAFVSGVSFIAACIATLISHGSSLPLKLQEAPITAIAGVVLIGAMLIKKPLPIARFIRMPAELKLDPSLNLLFGFFLVIHAALHIVLAITLPTSQFVMAARIVDWGGVLLFIVVLRTYLRHRVFGAEGKAAAKRTTS
jgi:intracellular septation protein A